MEFEEITEDAKVFPGEFLLHVPKKTIVVCGAFKGDTIRVLDNGRLVEDKVQNFKKIKLNDNEREERYVSRCKGCGR
jgi:hypothetical protein|tara:strand:+ start:1137 stop:1367 length:231 start_codon:yes stop_codon:yes gene_type:complete